MIERQSNLALRAVYIPLHLKQPHLRRFVARAGHALSNDPERLRELCDELDDQLNQAGEAELEQILRARALISVLEDMHDNGWRVRLEDNELYLCEPAQLNSSDPRIQKAADRRRMRRRVLDQLSRESYAKLIQRLEAGSSRTGRSAEMLFADGEQLVESLLERGTAALKPYLQLARPCDGVDRYTGLRLYDCFLYLRFHWSFPFESSPGRRLPILIRDAGQPHHPVIGLLCLSSPIPELGARDAYLGWTASSLEALLAGLEACEQVSNGEPAALDLLRSAMLSTPGAPRESWLASALAEQLDLSAAHDLNALRRALLREDFAPKLRRARLSLIKALIDGVDVGLDGLSFEGLGVSQPTDSAIELEEIINELTQRERHAHSQWRTGRSNGQAAGSLRDALFTKKRAKRAVALLHSSEELSYLREALDDPNALRQALKELSPACEDMTLSPHGASLPEGLRIALREHKVNMLASQIAEISVCGALPPYNNILGGKLIAALAMSREVAQLYYDVYHDQISEIQSTLNGADFKRPAELFALSTSSFYSVGSAQYNRITLPLELGALRWREVGVSQGHGTLHFSSQTSLLLQRLLTFSEDATPVSGMFGEGPSERLRKLRDGFVELKLPADKLLKHGMQRIVYVATLDPAHCPGVKPSAPYRERGPSVDEISSWWGQRWLEPRLQVSRLDKVRSFKAADGLISRIYPEVNETWSSLRHEREREDEL